MYPHLIPPPVRIPNRSTAVRSRPHPPRDAVPALPATRGGVDFCAALGWCLVLAPWLAVVAMGGFIGQIVVGLVLALAIAGTRFRVTISTDGIEFRRWTCGLPVQRMRFLLDAVVELYEPWDTLKTEGVEIRDRDWSSGHSTGAFGPFVSEKAQRELLHWIQRHVEHARGSGGAVRR